MCLEISIQEIHGRLIDGDHNGKPGGNAIAILSRSGATIHAIVDHPSDPRRLPILGPAAVNALLERTDATELAKDARNVKRFNH